MSRKALILIVDDDESHRYTTRMMLQHGGYEIIEASGGYEALSRVAERPDLIMLDLHLPDVSGLEVCRILKGAASTAAVPIVTVTAAYPGSQERREALDAGADGYLIRPLDTAQLLATVRAVLSRRAA
jgi:DNA-binding response OmpR family regulator